MVSNNVGLHRYDIIVRAGKLGLHVLWAQNAEDIEDLNGMHLLNPDLNGLSDAIDKIESMIYAKKEYPKWIVIHTNLETFPIKE